MSDSSIAPPPALGLVAFRVASYGGWDGGPTQVCFVPRAVMATKPPDRCLRAKHAWRGVSRDFNGGYWAVGHCRARCSRASVWESGYRRRSVYATKRRPLQGRARCRCSEASPPRLGMVVCCSFGSSQGGHQLSAHDRHAGLAGQVPDRSRDHRPVGGEAGLHLCDEARRRLGSLPRAPQFTCSLLNGAQRDSAESLLGSVKQQSYGVGEVYRCIPLA